MGVKVHELAKELKISTAALRKHLSDLGCTVKSHMSTLEDDIEAKIRAKFNEQLAAMKKIEQDRKKFNHPAVGEAKMEKPVLVSKPMPVPVQEETQEAAKKPQQFNEYIPKKETPRPPAAEIKQNTDLPETAEKNQEDKPPRTEKPRYDNNRPQGDRPQGERPRYDNNRPQGDRPRYDRPRYDNNRPQGDRPQGERPRYDNNRPQGDRPPRDNRYQGTPRGDNRPQGEGRPPARFDKPQLDSRYQNENRRPTDGNRPQGNRSFDRRPMNKDAAPTSFRPRPTTPKPAATVPVVDDKDARKFGKTKKEINEDRSRHLKAKIQSTKKGKDKKAPVVAIDEAEIARNIKANLANAKKKKKYHKEEKTQAEISHEVVVSEFTSVSELAKIIGIQPTEIIAKFFQMGKMVTINQRLDRDSLEIICSEYDLSIVFQDEFGSDIIEDTIEKQAEDVVSQERPPVVTIMGHVDHGKTSILDYIRKENVVAGESGGITQHIGAYQVEYQGKKITFLDTPGHEAFTAMRSRGANVTDIAVIVVAANDGVMPQTVEAIDHAKAAGVTIIVAINKIDLPNANLDRTIAGIMEQNLYLENYGGNVLWTTCSAKTGEGIGNLLELILLSAEMKELKARWNTFGSGVVIESQKTQNMGTIATILLQDGRMSRGDIIVCGATFGRIRRMENERGAEVLDIYPSDVVVLYGLTDVPKAGDQINKVDSEKTARQISSERKLIRSERQKFQGRTNLSNVFEKIKENQMNEVKLIIKADTDGSVEALADSFQKISNDEVTVNIIHKSVGGIVEADIALATASDAIIIGFHVRANSKAKKMAEDENVDIKIYSIIYDAIDDVKKAVEGMLSPDLKEIYLGTAIIKQVFKVKKVGSIAGCVVEKGVIKRNAKMRLYRNNIMIHEGEVFTLQHFQDEVKEIKAGFECGLGLKDYNDVKENDVIEAFEIIEIKKEIQ